MELDGQEIIVTKFVLARQTLFVVGNNVVVICFTLFSNSLGAQRVFDIVAFFSNHAFFETV